MKFAAASAPRRAAWSWEKPGRDSAYAQADFRLHRLVRALRGAFLHGLAVLACVDFVFAVTLGLTERGLHTHADWAGVSAIILLVLAMLPKLVLAVSLQNVGRVVMMRVAIARALPLRTLWEAPVAQFH